MFHLNKRNLFRSPYWYSLMVTCFLLLYTVEFLRWWKNITNSADARIIGVILYWMACIFIPSYILSIILRRLKKK